jgi:uncharacterized protein with von Willebrand factor type A (vWA) domain
MIGPECGWAAAQRRVFSQLRATSSPASRARSSFALGVREVVVIVSDGWERGDPEVLGREMRRLRLVAHRVVWVNPRRAAPGFAPLVRGMAAALPSVDAFVSGHSLAAFDEVLAAIHGGEERA